MNLEKMEKVLGSYPAYRRRQAREALFSRLVSSWDEATSLPSELRERLQREAPPVAALELYPEQDGSAVRFLSALTDGARVESVLIRHRAGRNTVCVSSQTGCALGCAFCATAGLGPGRNLSPGEILGQVLAAARMLKPGSARLGGVVFMGMGEPLLNPDGVFPAVGEIVSPEGLNLAARKVSISTVGIVPGIMRLASFPLQVNLAVSLHAPDDELRDRLVPVNRKYPLGRLIPAIRDYIAATSRKVMIEYVLIEKLNDSPDQARALARLLRDGLGRLFFVNLIRANPARGYSPSSPGRLRRFREVLESRLIPVGIRSSFGAGVGGACGQLTGAGKRT